MSHPLVLIALAILPGLIYVTIFYRQDKQRKEPLGVLIKTFLWGAAVMLPIGLLQTLVPDWLTSSPLFFAAFMILVVGFSEELGKWLVIKFYSARSFAFDEVGDGILYGAVGAAGFAVFENIFYVLEHGFTTGIIRAFISVPGHIFWGAISGFWLAMHKFQKVDSGKMLVNGLFVSTLLHGLFNTFLSFPITIILAPLIVILSFIILRRLNRRATQLDQDHLQTAVIGEKKGEETELRQFTTKWRLGQTIFLFGWIFLFFSLFFALGFVSSLHKQSIKPIWLNQWQEFTFLFLMFSGAVLAIVWSSLLRKRLKKQQFYRPLQMNRLLAKLLSILLFFLMGMALLFALILFFIFGENFQQNLLQKISESGIFMVILFLFAYICFNGGRKLWRVGKEANASN